MGSLAEMNKPHNRMPAQPHNPAQKATVASLSGLWGICNVLILRSFCVRSMEKQEVFLYSIAA